MTLGKNIGFKGTNPVFLPPLLSKKSPHPCTAPEGDVCTCLQHCSVSIPPAPRQAKMQVFFFTQILVSSGALGHLLGGAGKSASKPLISSIALRWAGHTWNATILPSSEQLNGVGIGALIPHPFLFPLCTLGKEGRLSRGKGWIHPKAVVLFSVRQRQNFLLSSTSKASAEPGDIHFRNSCTAALVRGFTCFIHLSRLDIIIIAANRDG